MTRYRILVFPLLIAAIGACAPDPGDAVARPVAGAQLAAATPGDYVRTGSEVTVQRLATSGYTDFYASSISPDGRYMSMIDWSTYNLAVRDLGTDRIHRLTHVENERGQPWEEPAVSLFSPDGRRLVYGWYVNSDLQLRLIDFETGADGVPLEAEPMVLLNRPGFAPYFLFDWSLDGRLILAKAYIADNTRQLVLIDAADGTHRTLKSFDWEGPTRAAFSPDGRYVAYDHVDPDSQDRHIFVLSIDGTHEARIVDGPGGDRLLGWRPSGDILFHSDRGETPALWRIPVADGRPGGPAEMVRADLWSMEPLGFSDDRFYFGVTVDPTRVYTAPVDLETGRVTGAPVAMNDPARIEVSGWAWSPDGQYLALSGTIRGMDGSVIVIRSDAGDEIRTISVDLGATSRIRWAPDGQSILVAAVDDRSRRGFHRIDLKTGASTPIVRNEQLSAPTPRGAFDVSPDGRTIWFATNDQEEGRWDLIAWDIESRTEHPITPREWQVRAEGMNWSRATVSVSPDGTRLAIVVPDTLSTDRLIGTIPVAGGAFIPLARVERGVMIRGLEWLSNGLLYATRSTDPAKPGPWKAWTVDSAGGEPRPVELQDNANPFSMKPHPDGRRITLIAGRSRGEVWVMDGLQRSEGLATSARPAAPPRQRSDGR